MDRPTRYLDRDGAALAYQVIGNGPAEVVGCNDLTMHLDLAWTDPDVYHVLERYAGFARVTYFQPRGVGLSDPILRMPSLEEQARDILTVMDDVGVEKATIVAYFTTCGGPALATAMAPERFTGMVLVNPIAQGLRTTPLHGWTPEQAAQYAAGYERVVDQWGSGWSIDMWDPVQATPYNRRLMGMLERCSMTPTAIRQYVDWFMQLDLQDVFASVPVPTRVLRLPTNPVPEAAVRHVADLLPLGEFHLLPETLPGSPAGQAMRPVADHVEEMATGRQHQPEADRFLGTVLFTDLVSSTDLLAEIGDARYRDLRESHERMVRLAVEEGGGTLLSVTGDGTFSVFEGPSAAVRVAERIVSDAAGLGLQVRAGLHTGELQRDGRNVAGMTVHIGARVGAIAGAGQIVASRTVHDLMVGSGMRFESLGQHELKGVPGSWELFAVRRPDAAPATPAAPVDGSLATALDRAVLSGVRRAPAVSRAMVRLGNAIERRRAQAR
jgi:class 3 adenylate cyclase/pimeloyl-ACP methyl ester carboxylesterase